MKKFAIKRSFLTLVLLFVTTVALAQPADHFPGATWTHVENPASVGYSKEKLAEARQYTESIKTAAVVIVTEGKILDQWGDLDKQYQTHSIRKSVLSALYGRYVREGVIDLDLTMADLNLDDEPPLSDIEKEATVRDCIKARSGIYHPALYESARMKELKPARHTVLPGTHWYYNNWDFNVLGTIFEKMTGKGVFEAIQEEIAGPIQMEAFDVATGTYVTGEESIYPAYPFRITARDLARFGVLMLHKGRWKDRQLLPADWVEESTRYHSDATLYNTDGYGYMWWVARDHNKYPHLPGVEIPEGSYSARGAGGHYLLIIPAYDLIIVHRVDTDTDGQSVSAAEMGELVRLILEARMPQTP